jgi:hypothetical protein
LLILNVNLSMKVIECGLKRNFVRWLKFDLATIQMIS